MYAGTEGRTGMGQDVHGAAARRTGTAHAAGGSVAVSGVLIGDVVQHLAAPVRSGYLQQVHRIAPPELWDRQAELAELADFCRAPGTGPYAWWRVPAWSGKSALMAHFVLAPPPGVRVVSRGGGGPRRSGCGPDRDGLRAGRRCAWHGGARRAMARIRQRSAIRPRTMRHVVLDGRWMPVRTAIVRIFRLVARFAS